MPADIDKFMFAGEKAWHGVGLQMDDLFTPQEAAGYAYDWEPETQDLVTAGGIIVPDHRAVIRSDTKAYLAVVGMDWEAFGNREMAMIGEALQGESGATVETAGSLEGGKTVFLLLRMPNVMTVKARGGEDRTERYLLITQGHDGRTPVMVFFTDVRVVCANTHAMAVNAWKSKSKGKRRKTAATSGFAIRHTRNMRDRVALAVSAMKEANNAFRERAEVFQAMADVTLTADAARDYFATVIPVAEDAADRAKTRANNVRSQLLTNYATGRGSDLAGSTLWGAFNAVTEYADHQRPIRGQDRIAERRFESLLRGTSADLKAGAMDAALAVLDPSAN
jgi:phage/plasmid-like protein (TIGR03299 family)